MTQATRTKSAWLYDLRWLLSLIVLGAIAAAFTLGAGRVAWFSAAVDSLQDDPPAVSEPKIFDGRYDIWFDPEDPGLQLYQSIEDQFVAEDFVLVGFEELDHPLGVFSPQSLATIAELTEAIQRVPFVRHVRSLTSNPWIRWGAIEADAETGATEQGLLITDLFERAPESYDEDAVIERAVAVLGADRAAALIGETRVRAVLGPDADFADLIGEPRLVGNVISADGRTTALQVQVLRPLVSAEQQLETFGDDDAAQLVGKSMHSNVSQWQALDGIEAVLAEKGGGFEFHIAGMPPFERNFTVVGQEDMAIVGWMFLVIVAVMFVMFRRITAVVAPLVVVFSSILGMLGAIWLLGDLLNNMTAAAPNMVTAISIADSIHLIAAYYMLRGAYTDKRALIIEVIRRNALPVFLTSVTTAIGFFSLTAGNIIPLQMLGYTAGIGSLLAWIVSMTVVPAVLSLLPLRRTTIDLAAIEANERAHWSSGMLSWVLTWRKPIAAGSLVVTALAIFGLARIHLDTDFRTAFPDDNVTMVDLAWLEDRLGGAGDLEIVFDAPTRDESQEQAAARASRLDELSVRAFGAEELPDLLRPLDADERAELAHLQEEEADYQRRRIAISAEFLSELRRFSERLRGEMADPSSSLAVITRIDGALEVLRKIHQVQNENRAAFYRPPDEADVAPEARTPQLIVDDILEEVELIPAQDASTLAAQYYLQYENGARPTENLETLLSADRNTVRVQGRVEQASSLEQQAAFDRIREIADAEFPLLTGTTDEVERGEALSTMTLSGKTLLYAGMTEKFSDSYIFSMSLALVLITLLITAIYRSVVMGLLSIVPNVLPIVIPIGFFGLVGRVVDGPAVFVSSVALGICVDDTIHFFTKFTRARKRGLRTEDALRAALHEVGNALTITTVVLVLGFAVLAFSQFTPNSMMGKLAALMIGLAWVADFIVTPALLTFLPDPNLKTTASETKPSVEPEVPALT